MNERQAASAAGWSEPKPTAVLVLADGTVLHGTGLGAAGMKDMGRVMAALKERYSGKMDFAKAGGLVKGQLAS